jgi:uncharacterized protein YcfJ
MGNFMQKILLLVFCQIFAFADVISLKDGRTIPGLVESGATGEIRIKIGDNPQVIAVDQIQSIRFEHSLTLPADTEIAVRTIDPIDSESADLHHEYAASLDDPILVNGVEVAPASAKAVLRVVELTKPSRINPRGRIALSTSLVAMIIDGQRVEVKTDRVDSRSGSPAKRTATGAAVGAGAGAAIGAMAGGGVGAGIGAGVGAAAGAAAGVFKGPPPVKIPAETRFTYKLTEQAISDSPGPALPKSVQADTLTLRDGASVTGSWTGMDVKQISFLVNDQPQTYPRSQVSAVTFGPPKPTKLDPIAAPPPPPDAPAAPPQTISLGLSIDQVVSILGQPRNIADLGSKKIYTFPDFKVTFINGKVTDVQ